MKNIIYSNYNILVYDINKDKKNYFFYFDEELYLFYQVLNDINNVIEVYNYVVKNNVESFKIIKNKNGELFTKVDNNYYALLIIKGIIKYEYNINNFRYCTINKNGSNWGKLWGDRLDYYEHQIRELGIKYQTVLNSFGFYKGIAENAILYFNLSIEKFKEPSSIGIMHNRINYPCYLIDYNNPINYVIDYNIRDIAEYIKSYMLSEDYEIESVLNMLNNLKLNKLMFNLLYSRLLYPNFYFDIFDTIILEDGLDKDVLKIVDKSDKYINLLKEIYNTYKMQYDLFRIEWLDKIKM